jgi:hypothetical protein
MVVRHVLCLFEISLCHVFWLILPLLPRFTPMFYEPCVYILLYTTHIFGCRMLDLVEISMPNSYCTMLIETKSFENLNFFSYSRLLSSITKKGEIERASRPLVILVINDNVVYYD